MKLHLPKALFAAVLAVVCGQAYAATYADWTISTDASGQTVFTTTQDGAYDINLGAAAITTNNTQPYSITVLTTKSDGWTIPTAGVGSGLIVASTSNGSGSVQNQNNFTVRFAQTESGEFKGKTWINNWGAYGEQTLTKADGVDTITTLGATIVMDPNKASGDKKLRVTTAEGSDLIGSAKLIDDNNLVSQYNYATLSNMGAGLSDYSNVRTTVTVVKNSSAVSNVTIGSLTTADTAVTLNNVAMTGTLTATGTGSFTISGNTNLSGLTPVSAAIRYGESVDEAKAGGNGYAFGTYTYAICTADSNISFAEGVTFSNTEVNAVAGTYESSTGHLSMTNGTAAGAYTINQGGTIAYTTGSAIASANTTSVVVNATSTLNMGAGTTLNKANLTANQNVTLDGSGLYIADSATTLGDHVSLAGSWSGTVQLTGQLNKDVNFLGALAKDNATIEMKGVTRWTSNWAGKGENAVSQNIKLTNNGGNAAWTYGAYYTDNTGVYSKDATTFSGTWSGDGNFMTNISDGGVKGMRYIYTGDISQWTGAFKVSANNANSVGIVQFGGNATEVNAVIQRDSGILRVVVDTDATFNKAITNAALLTINANKRATMKQDLTIDSVVMEAGSSLNFCTTGSNKNLRLNAASSLNNLTVQDLDFKNSGETYTVTMSGINTVNGLLDMSRSSGTPASLLVKTGSSLTHKGNELWMCSTNTGILLEEGATFTRKSDFTVKGLSSVEESLGHIAWTNTDGDGQFNNLNQSSVTISNAELTVTSNQTISTGLSNVTLTTGTNTITLNTDATLTGLEFGKALTISSGKTLTLSGTASYTGATQTRGETPTDSNGFGATITYANAFSGAGTVNSTATWTLNGTAATLNGKELSYSTATNVYYINSSDDITNITADHIGNADGNISSDVTLTGNAGTVGMKLTGTQTGATYTFSGAFTGTGNLVIEPTTPAAGNLADTYVFSGAITHTGAIVATSNTEVVFNGDSTNITTALKAPNGHITAYYEHGENVTVTGEINNNPWENKQGAIDLNVTDNTTVAFNGAVKADKLTVEEGSAAALNAESNLKDTVTINGDLTVNAASTVKQLGGLGTVKALADLTVTEGNVKLGGLVIGGDNKTVTLGSAASHNHTLTLNNLTVAGSGSVINANLAISGGTMTMSSSVEMGCSVTLGADGKEALTLTNATLNGEGQLENYILFTDVESLTLASGDPVAMGWYDASTVFSFLSVNGGEAVPIAADQYVIGYWNGTVSIADKAVPEPATATLSLLALAALAARRKRK